MAAAPAKDAEKQAWPVRNSETFEIDSKAVGDSLAVGVSKLGSPGIFTTSTDYLGQFREKVASPLVHDTKMFLTLGSLEANGGVAFYEEMGRGFNSMVSSLRSKPHTQLSWGHKLYPGCTHTSLFAQAINDALLYLYGPEAG